MKLQMLDKGYIPKIPVTLLTCNVYSTKLCQGHTDKLFVFGENQQQQNSGVKGGGQAVIRPEFNTYGFCTLSEIGRYWEDDNYSDNIIQIETDIRTIKLLLVSQFMHIVFPMYGLGTGRAGMLSSCPKTFLYMSKRLLSEFNFNNLEHLAPPNF